MLCQYFILRDATVKPWLVSAGNELRKKRELLSIALVSWTGI